MTNQQITTIKCAHADLVGSYQAYKSLDIHSHDWEAHLTTIKEIERDFTFVEPAFEYNPNNGIMLACSCGQLHEPNPDNYIIFDSDNNPKRNEEGEIQQYTNNPNETDPTCIVLQVKDTTEEIKNEIRRQNKKHLIKNK